MGEEAGGGPARAFPSQPRGSRGPPGACRHKAVGRPRGPRTRPGRGRPRRGLRAERGSLFTRRHEAAGRLGSAQREEAFESVRGRASFPSDAEEAAAPRRLCLAAGPGLQPREPTLGIFCPACHNDRIFFLAFLFSEILNGFSHYGPFYRRDSQSSALRLRHLLSRFTVVLSPPPPCASFISPRIPSSHLSFISFTHARIHTHTHTHTHTHC